jgi:hypothetical protein
LSLVVLHKGIVGVISIIVSGLIFYLYGKRGAELVALTLFGSLGVFLSLVFAMAVFPRSVKLEQLPPEPPVVSSRGHSLNLRDKPPR